jgi:hypothetical protein
VKFPLHNTIITNRLAGPFWRLHLKILQPGRCVNSFGTPCSIRSSIRYILTMQRSRLNGGSLALHANVCIQQYKLGVSVREQEVEGRKLLLLLLISRGGPARVLLIRAATPRKHFANSNCKLSGGVLLNFIITFV